MATGSSRNLKERMSKLRPPPPTPPIAHLRCGYWDGDRCLSVFDFLCYCIVGIKLRGCELTLALLQSSRLTSRPTILQDWSGTRQLVTPTDVVTMVTDGIAGI